MSDPLGVPFIVDENQSGGAANLHLPEVLWGRLVDIHTIDAMGERVDPPVFVDFVINPNIFSDGTSYVLDRNLVTQRERLVVQDMRGADVPGSDDDRFFDLVQAADVLAEVAPKNDDGSSSPPFTTVPRNACMVLRFDDCLDDSDDGALLSTVRVFTGYPPLTPFAARVIFDPNHGAKVGGSFHSTRVLVDMATSETEASDPDGPAFSVNAIGLPASQTNSSSANVSVRIPAQDDLGSGQPTVLTNLSGASLDPQDNGPVDLDIPTQDVVRAVKSGNPNDPIDSNGFLRDKEKPRVIGGWPITVTNPTNDSSGDLGFDFEIDLTFTTSCLNVPAVGDGVTVGANFAQVTGVDPLAPNVDLKVRTAFRLDNPQGLAGAGLFQAPFQTSLTLAPGCWVSFLPEALTFPTTGVETTAQILARFSEPMDPESLSPFGGFLVVGGAAGATSTAIASNIVVGEVLPANRDLTAYSFVPELPLPHTLGVANDTFHVELSPDATDLAGNRLRNRIPFVDFTIAELEEEERNAAIVLRFESNDEYAPDGSDPNSLGDPPDSLLDLRGQFFYDEGRLLPRPVAFAGWPVDRNNPVPSRMFPVGGLGRYAPLNARGVRLQMLWRYCDAGWDVRDETKYNLDVIGLSWAPFSGVTADFYDRFEILLGHSRFLPDEGGPIFPQSGLPSAPFDDNYLAGSNPLPLSRGGVVVHNQALGYAVNPADRFRATSGTEMMPFPLNRGMGSDVTYTWRDTSILALGADGDPNQKGIPLQAEFAAGLIGPMEPGSVAGPGAVPSFGLPLLVEFRCHPSDQGLGFNFFSLGLANGLPFSANVFVPAFRAYSSGGINTNGNEEFVLPDAEISPRGGLNPNGFPPGTRTRFPVDNVFYLGQLDTVVRVSRVHTVWLDAGTAVFPQWQLPVLEPSLAGQPLGTGLLIDYRSATGFSEPGSEPFDATKLDPYGDQIDPDDPQPQSLSDWSSQISIGNSKRYLQLRLTLSNNIETRVGPELDALALPYIIQ